MRAESRALLLEAVPPLREARTCLYTNAPDGHFLIDRHPGHPQVWIVSACSGHGFKSASAIGEVLADLTLGRESGFDLTPFAFERLAPATPGVTAPARPRSRRPAPAMPPGTPYPIIVA